MEEGQSGLRFFADHCVPESVVLTLISLGHQAQRLRDNMDRESIDPEVAIAAAQAGYVLITHDRDYRSIGRLLNLTRRQQRQLHRVELTGRATRSSQRLIELMPLIVSEWQIAEASAKPLTIWIMDESIRIFR